MATLSDLAHHLSPLVVDPEIVAGDGEVVDLCLHAPDGPIAAGDLVLGTWVRHAEDAVALIRTAGGAGAAAVVVDLPVDDELRTTARRHRVGIATKSITASWAEVFRAAQSALGASDLGPGGAGDRALHELTDRGALLLDGPITIEDLAGNVLAHSQDQHDVDEVRRDAIVNRAVTPDRLDRHRGLGVYDALAGGVDQVVVPADPPGDRPDHPQPQHHRVVLGVHTPGGDLIGTVWVVRTSPVPVAELATVGAWLLAVGQQIATGSDPSVHGAAATARALRSILHHAPAPGPLDLGTPPWVVGLIGCAVRSQDVQLTIWHGLFQRRGWRDPLLTTVDAGVVCVLREDSDGPGSVAWWVDQLDEALADPETSVAVGNRAMSTTELRHSHDDAQELTRTIRLWPELTATVLRPDQHWAEVILLRLLERRHDPAGAPPTPMQELLQQPEYLVTTLWHYLATGASIPRTAEALTIHPNTLRYRLDKIRSCGVDIDRTTVRQALHLQMLALRADGRLPSGSATT